jgi:hypothetical protein
MARIPRRTALGNGGREPSALAPSPPLFRNGAAVCASPARSERPFCRRLGAWYLRCRRHPRHVPLCARYVCVFLLVLLAGAAPFALAEELPLSVSPSVAKPGDTITVTGEGFQPGATGLVWGGGPYQVGGVSTPGGYTHKLAVVGEYAYVVDGIDGGGLYIVDVSTPTAPVVVGSVQTPGQAWDVSVEGHYAYVADSAGGLQVINVSNASAPVIVGSAASAGPYAVSVSVKNGYAYVAAMFGGLRIFDVHSPSMPILVGLVDTPGYALDVTLAGHYAYVADGSKGLQVVDIRSPEDAFIVGSVDTPRVASSVRAIASESYHILLDLAGGTSHNRLMLRTL